LKNSFKEITDKASISIKIENGSMVAYSEFRLFNRFNIGILLLLTLGIGIIIISIVNANGIELAIGLLIGIVLTISFLAVLLKQLTDYLVVTDKEIVFRNSLRKRTFQITPDLKVKTVIERKYTKATHTGGSYSRGVEVFIKKDKIKYRVFDFLMEDEYSEEVKYLSKMIKRFIRKKIEDSVVSLT
jgi:hypothetical protein